MNKDDGLCVANHVLDSILKDLAFLKDNSYLPEHTYRDVLATLPTRLTNNYNTTNNIDYNNNNNVAKPPLPIRKSTSSSVSFPVPAPREASPSFPKLPTRRTNEWNSPAPAPAVVAPVAAAAAAAAQEKAILHTEPQKVPPPPAYTPTTSLATAEALYDYAGEDPETDLSFKQGDVIEVTEYGIYLIIIY
jgi:hypothetical protein